MIGLGLGITSTARGAAGPVPGPANTRAPVLTGQAMPGQTLQLDRGAWTGSGAIAYALEIRVGARLAASGSGATLDYTVAEIDRGETVFGLVRATDATGTRIATSPGRDVPQAAAPASETHVFLIAGQSNAMSRAAFDGGADWPAGQRQLERWRPLADPGPQPPENEVAPGDARLIPAARPLHHHGAAAGAFGWALQFTRDYLAGHPDTDIVLIPCAKGSTGFSSGDWNRGDPLYADAVARVNAVMAANPAFRFRGILWHQGERETNDQAAADAHPAALDAMIAGLRADISAADATTPFVLGGLVAAWVAGVALHEQVQTQLAATPDRVAYAGFADSTGTSGSPGDAIHFDAASLRLMGSRYAAALDAARADLPAPPGQVTAFTAGAGVEEVALSWAAPDSELPVTGYRLRRDGAVLATLGAVTAYTDTGLTAGTEYGYRVAALSPAGEGPPSALCTATPAAPGDWTVSGATVTSHPAAPSAPGVSGTTVSL